eukprot:scaffold3587_cov364-Prasinococcus_capsulatus_cf.AAC.6
MHAKSAQRVERTLGAYHVGSASSRDAAWQVGPCHPLGLLRPSASLAERRVFAAAVQRSARAPRRAPRAHAPPRSACPKRSSGPRCPSRLGARPSTGPRLAPLRQLRTNRWQG